MSGHTRGSIERCDDAKRLAVLCNTCHHAVWHHTGMKVVGCNRRISYLNGVIAWLRMQPADVKFEGMDVESLESWKAHLISKSIDERASGQYRVFDSEVEKANALSSLEGSLQKREGLDAMKDELEHKQAINAESIIEIANSITDVPGGYEPKQMTDATDTASQENNIDGYRRRVDRT